jgi:L-ribulose-5-phosphate 4-epimerase
MPSDGSIKFICSWKESAPLANSDIAGLNRWRDRLYALGLAGVYENGVGFGNISQRVGKSHEFIITGSATGGIEKLDERYYTRVTDYDFDHNSLSCIGPIKASSESLSHAIIYELDPSITGINHIHNKKFWEKSIGRLPTTREDVPYGTPEMAWEIERLFKESDVRKRKILAMGGHEEGIISFGKDLDETGRVLLRHMGIKD